ncbi:MAG: hypothetical protein IPG88_16550 [Gemmatimonadetes bacterium]|nr:hypothetical protein [Gemmatimonadota bacterium]
MNTTAWRLLPVAAATIVALLLVRVASFVPLRDARAEHAWVRLSWSARPERIEQCRRLTDAELAERPEHIRLRLECEGRFARYLLQLTVDGVITLADTIQGDGLRHDRPMHVLREASLAPGLAPFGRPSRGSTPSLPPTSSPSAKWPPSPTRFWVSARGASATNGSAAKARGFHRDCPSTPPSPSVPGVSS